MITAHTANFFRIDFDSSMVISNEVRHYDIVLECRERTIGTYSMHSVHLRAEITRQASHYIGYIVIFLLVFV